MQNCWPGGPSSHNRSKKSLTRSLYPRARYFTAPVLLRHNFRPLPPAPLALSFTSGFCGLFSYLVLQIWVSSTVPIQSTYSWLKQWMCQILISPRLANVNSAIANHSRFSRFRRGILRLCRSSAYICDKRVISRFDTALSVTAMSSSSKPTTSESLRSEASR